MDFNRENKKFIKLFPDLLKRFNNNHELSNYKDKKSISINSSSSSNSIKMNQLWILIFGILLSIIGFILFKQY